MEGAWANTALERIRGSPSFSEVCRSIVTKAEGKKLVRSLQQCSSDGERDILIDDLYRELWESGESREFERTVAKELDEGLALAIERARRRNPDRGLAEIVEHEAGEAMLSIVQRLEPGPPRTAALRALLGRPLPTRLRRPIWLSMLPNDSRTAEARRRPSLLVSGQKKLLLPDLVGKLMAAASQMWKCCKNNLGNGRLFSPGNAQALAAILLDRCPQLPPPPEFIWLALPLFSVLGEILVSRGLDAALLSEQGLGFILQSKYFARANEKEMNLLIQSSEGIPIKKIPNWYVPRVWMERFLYVIAEADTELFQVLLVQVRVKLTTSCTLAQRQSVTLDLSDEIIENIARISVGPALRSGLAEVLSAETAIFVWDQCFLATPALVLPLAAACIFMALKVPILRLHSQNCHTETHDLLRVAGPDLALVELESLFNRHAMPRLRNDCLSARSLDSSDSLVLDTTQLGPLRRAVLENDFAFVPSTSSVQIPQLDEPLTWPSVEPIADDLATIVEKFLSERTHSSAAARSCALEVARSVPGVLALSLQPNDLVIEFETLLKQHATQIELRLKPEPVASLLGIEPPILSVTLPPAADRSHAEAAVVWALRASSQGLWPKLRHAVPTLADRARCAQLAPDLIDGEESDDSDHERKATDPIISKEEESKEISVVKSNEERNAAIEAAFAIAKSARETAIVVVSLARKHAIDAHKMAEAFDAANIQILLAVEATQKRAFGRVYSRDSLNSLDAKALKTYTKKHPKWLKEFKKRYDKDSELQSVIPDLSSFLLDWVPPPPSLTNNKANNFLSKKR